MSVRGMAVWLCVASMACSSNGAEEQVAEKSTTEAEEPPQPEAPEQVAPEATRGLMRGHYEKALEAREALIRADLPRAREAMKWLASHQRADDLPPELRGLLLDMQKSAKEFEDAESLREAADALAQTLSRCGSCHEATGKGPNIAETPQPDGKGAIAHMHRHHWAAKRMWDGLVTASPQGFDEAAAALDEKPLTAKELGEGNDLPAKDVARLDAHIHGLRAKVEAPDTEAGRIELYARTMATCATCHELMGRGPAPVEDE